MSHSARFTAFSLSLVKSEILYYFKPTTWEAGTQIDISPQALGRAAVDEPCPPHCDALVTITGLKHHHAVAGLWLITVFLMKLSNSRHFLSCQREKSPALEMSVVTGAVQ